MEFYFFKRHNEKKMIEHTHAVIQHCKVQISSVDHYTEQQHPNSADEQHSHPALFTGIMRHPHPDVLQEKRGQVDRYVQPVFRLHDD